MNDPEPTLPDEFLAGLLAEPLPESHPQESLPGSVRERIRQFNRLLNALPVEPNGACLLYHEPGTNASRCVPLTGRTLVVGRTPRNERNPDGSDLAFDDDTMSRTHFHIENAGGLHVLRDLESHNGTYLNAILTRVDYAVLKAGDIVRAGNVVFAFTGE